MKKILLFLIVTFSSIYATDGIEKMEGIENMPQMLDIEKSMALLDANSRTEESAEPEATETEAIETEATETETAETETMETEATEAEATENEDEAVE